MFVAVPLPVGIAAAASALLPEHPALRRVRPEQMHLTLAFLGETPAGRLPEAAEAVARGAGGHQRFRLRLDTVGCFPPSGAPRVVWLGASAGRDALVLLGRDVRAALAQSGLPFDPKPLQAHVTLARVREKADRGDLRAIARGIEGVTVAPLEVPVDEVVLLESVIGSGGPRYTRRAAAVLDEVGGDR